MRGCWNTLSSGTDCSLNHFSTKFALKSFAGWPICRPLEGRVSSSAGGPAMDISQAIDAHNGWKGRLAAYLAQPDQSLDAAAIALDDQCDLGRWLQGEGLAESGWAGFAQLIGDHARFHAEAASLVKRADAGERITEEAALGFKSEYAKASNAVITALMLIKSRRKQMAQARPAAWDNDGPDSDPCVPSFRSGSGSDSCAVTAPPGDERAASWPGE
jgi:Chemoreceptor zinc-binding domain